MTISSPVDRRRCVTAVTSCVMSKPFPMVEDHIL